MWIQQNVETAVIVLGCRQDMEIEIDRFEMARAQIAEVGCSCVLVSRFDVLEQCLLERSVQLSTSQLSSNTKADWKLLQQHIVCALVHATTARQFIMHYELGVTSFCFMFAEVFLHG